MKSWEELNKELSDLKAERERYYDIKFVLYLSLLFSLANFLLVLIGF